MTTIVVVDVAGFSRLMNRDEEGTHARLTALCREVLEPAIDAHGGTLIKRTGDGLLAEFASVVEALRCAVEIQQGATDIFGDGVNVAARLEGLAEPGGIVVSRAVRDHVRDRLKLTFEDLA